MPKRSSENKLDYIANKLRKLEREVKRSRHPKSNCVPTSSSSSSSSRSTSPSHGSRSPSPEPDQNPNNLGETTCPVHADTIDIELPSAVNTEAILTQDKESHPSTDVLPNNVMAPCDLEDPTLSPELLEILGADPSVTQEYGPDINKEVASRFAHIATSGLDKEIRKDLIKKFLVPSNCTNIDAPQLNLEIKAALTEQVVKRDKAIESRQKQMAAGISALGKIISDQLLTKDKNNDLIKDLMEVGRIFCDIQHSESETRRNFTLYTVKKELKEQLSKTKIDKFLFGSNFTETLKTAKAVSKSSADLKPEAERKSKTPSANSTSRYLNWKARAPARRPSRHAIRRLHRRTRSSAGPRRTPTSSGRSRPAATKPATGIFITLPWLPEYCPDGDAAATSSSFRLRHRTSLNSRQHPKTI